jgi:hypothetical protein
MEQTKDTSDYKIINIVKDFKDTFKDKNTAFALLLRLKQSLEFNSTVNWTSLYTELGQYYKDYRPYYSSGMYTPDPIDRSTMRDTDIFVFGSNTEGRHGGGAARVAMTDYDAIYGQARGLQGRAYAIVTKDLSVGEQSIKLEDISAEIDQLIEFALDRQDLTFWVTKIGCGLGGYEIKDIAPLFANKLIPNNIMLPYEFVAPQYYMKYFYSDKMKKFFHIKNNNHIIVVSVGTVKEITEVKMNNVIANLPEDITNCDKDDFILASEEVLKELY